MRLVRWVALLSVLALNLVMSAPVYYLLGRIDLTGNSTGFYRAALIESTIRHFNEWWLGGTDYTRHWMASGVPWSQDHVDITNYYIRMGVDGGLPLMLLFIYILVVAFRIGGTGLAQQSRRTLRASIHDLDARRHSLWPRGDLDVSFLL